MKETPRMTELRRNGHAANQHGTACKLCVEYQQLVMTPSVRLSPEREAVVSPEDYTRLELFCAPDKRYGDKSLRLVAESVARLLSAYNNGNELLFAVAEAIDLNGSGPDLPKAVADLKADLARLTRERDEALARVSTTTQFAVCLSCVGRGTIPNPDNYYSSSLLVTCPACKGEGRIITSLTVVPVGRADIVPSEDAGHLQAKLEAAEAALTALKRLAGTCDWFDSCAYCHEENPSDPPCHTCGRTRAEHDALKALLGHGDATPETPGKLSDRKFGLSENLIIAPEKP